MQPFALLTKDMVLLPSPFAADVASYRALFQKLNRDADFCRIAYGPSFVPGAWTDEETRDWFATRDGKRWAARGMGDFAVGLLPVDEGTGQTAFDTLPGTLLARSEEPVRRVTGEAFSKLAGSFETLRWGGYACVRDATTDLPEDGQKPVPAWQDLVEVRYGMDPSFRGRGVATRAQRVVMDWSVEELGVRRFLGITEVNNTGSKRVLTRLGFRESGTRYYGHEGAYEWLKEVEGAEGAEGASAAE